MSSTPTKRSSDGDGSAEKRLKTEDQEQAKPVYDSDIRKWADWLVKRDIGTVLGGEPSGAHHAGRALYHATYIDDVDYQDALIDFLIVRFHDKNDPTKLDIPRFRTFMSSRWAYRLHIIPEVLILHHDAKAAATGHYDHETRQRVEKIAFKHFSAPDECPKDPLSLSTEEFCKTYHQHHTKDLPCYKTQKLPDTSE
ncbi:hypothetical protein D6C83_05191 [Aureobasidium pullulans]|uniref:Uncharacterized protein n=1 Tax=Aureobasidium pullulans TaxID=5580 RepID=A0A4T0CLH9_AURPU|nr:hypothetical protein D6C83_05191 [Aureobasidium pullulans]